MAISIKTVADKTYNLLKGYGFNIDTFNKVGEVVGDPAEAIRFFVEDPNLLVTLNVPDEEIRLSISKNTEQTDKLRKQLENLSKDYLMNLDFRVFGRTLKPSSDSVDVAKETNMKETNELRKLAGLPLKVEEADEFGTYDGMSLEDKLKDIIGMYQRQIEEYEKNAKDFERDHGELDDSDEKQNIFMDYVMDVNLEDTEDKLEAFKQALSDHQQHGTTHWWQSDIGGSLDTAVRDEIAMYLQEIGAWMGDLEEAVEEADEFKGSTKDGHKYRAKADDQDYSQYLKVFYGDGKYFRIYYDSRVTGGKAGGYDPKGIETNDPRAEEVFANLPDDFFKKYGSEGETGLEDIIDMIKKEDIKEEMDADAWYKSMVDHDSDDVYKQWEKAFSQADTKDKVDVALKNVQTLLADGPIEDYDPLWRAWDSGKDISDMLPKFQAMAKKSAGTPELRMMGEEAISEATLGAVHGSLKTSYQPLDNVKLVVKHSKPVNEEVRGARSRNISKIFIQANEERFLFPSKNLQGARAMARHIYNGGVMHDSIGESIVQMCKDFGTLKEFIRYVNKKGLINEDNQEYVTLARQQMDNIRTAFKRVAGVKTYSKAVESITDESNIDIVTEVNLEDHFTETHFDDKVGNAHETLSKLVNRKNAFEQYIMNAIENENFANAKELIQEEPIEFENAHQRLGYQVGQLSSCVKDSKLANYLGGIGNKLSSGGQLDAMEYRAVKASLLSAQRPQQPVMATEMSLAESTKYQKFIESFDVEV